MRRLSRNKSGGVGRVWIERGFLLQPLDVEHKGRTYHLVLEYQVFTEDGLPIESSYRGPGTVTHDMRVILGDHFKQANLTELKVDRRPTTESNDYVNGFKVGLTDRRQVASWALPKKGVAKYVTQSQRWWDGYATAWHEKKS